jgi:hypothetical protein
VLQFPFDTLQKSPHLPDHVATGIERILHREVNLHLLAFFIGGSSERFVEFATDAAAQIDAETVAVAQAV